MRKDTVDRELSKINGLNWLKGRVDFAYSVTGVNLDRLINLLQKRGVTLKNVKKTSPKTLTFALSVKTEQKFFAILENLCYNESDIDKKRQTVLSACKNGEFVGGGYSVKRLGRRGIFSPLLKLAENVGVVIGLALFLAIAILSNDLVLGVTYSGNGSALAVQVQEFIKERGVNKFARFSSLDLDQLSLDIVTKNPNVSFAECEKRGNYLKIYLALASVGGETLRDDVENLYSDADGQVYTVKVYRGTPTVKEGDQVNAGDLLVGGYAIIKEQTIKTNVLAKITLKRTFNFTQTLKSNSAKAQVEALALEELGDKQTLGVTTVVLKQKDGYKYSVKIEYLHLITAG